MSERIVTTQAELDAAIAEKVDRVEIRSAKGVWLSVRASGSASVTACGSASVTASGSASVRACGSASVTAYDSASVTASGSASVTAYGSSSVTAYDSSSVRAYGSSTVTASGSASVTAYGSSTVTAYGSTAVHLHSAHVHLTGGTVIDHTKVDDFDAKQWCEYHGVTVSRGIATLYKAVNDAWTTDRGFDYSPGAKPVAPDWNDRNECGGGLHFGPSPVHALRYFEGATKFLAVGVRLTEMVPITGSTAKAKAKRVARACVEVDVHGRPVTAEAAAAKVSVG